MDPMNMPFMQAATCTAAPELSCLGEHSQIKFCNFVAIKKGTPILKCFSRLTYSNTTYKVKSKIFCNL